MKSHLGAILVLVSSISVYAEEDPNFMGLGDLAGGAVESTATAVSADGKVVVGYSKSSGLIPSGGDEAFRWEKSGQMIGLGALQSEPNFRFSRATGVNGDGSIVIGD